LIEKIKEKNEDVIFVGDGISKYKEALEEALPNCSFAPSHSSYPRAASVGELGLRLLESGVSHDLNTYAPIYLRKSQAEREYEERMRLK
ncbi:tRNA (adenosine(37)-N6)-threonylcarbamoyltransferase complex dimerization subunit type 1 TsaB, partial [Clostridium perfringens]|nr:tRNA (adenosine(37)-N6)-threonylcarbamoyltransferase complex dimerization subunit type 1 TsaB [Clostridium perfringens]